MSGRTSWWAHDAGWHRRERQVELGEEFGAAGPHVLAVLHSMAQEQQHTGHVKAGFRALAREAFVTIEQCREIVDFAAAIGALDDLRIAHDDKRFTARVSGWESEQPQAKATAKKREQRAKTASRTAGDQPGQSGTTTDESPAVRKVPPTSPDLTSPEGRERESAPASSSPPATFPFLRPVDDLVAAGIPGVFPGMWPGHRELVGLVLTRLDTPVLAATVEWLVDEAPRWGDQNEIARHAAKTAGFKAKEIAAARHQASQRPRGGGMSVAQQAAGLARQKAWEAEQERMYGPPTGATS